MKLEVEVISRESVKPSSPTPSELSHYDLSFLDQIAPPVYMPLVVYYEASDSHSEKLSLTERCDLLKKSLSESLTRFYPLAGRVKENLYVDCNDEGAEFLQAQVKCKLSEVITNPVPSELDKLLPRELDDVDVLFAVQVNFFNCGGMAVGACISHKVADGFSYFTFVKSWAATARGDEGGALMYPEFDGSKLFPPRELAGYEPNNGITKDKIVTKRFAFADPKISALRHKYASGLEAKDSKPPTRIEALSSFIWNRFATATAATSGPNTLYLILHTVNLRARMDPPLPDNHFGNMLGLAITKLPMKSSEEGFEIVEQVRQAIGQIDADYIKKFQEGDEYLRFLRASLDMFNKGDMVTFNFTSLCRFPLYEADFGWGKPIWVSSVAQVFKKLVVFMDSWSGDGIEAWVTLEDEDMAKFEIDEELQVYAT